MSAQWNFRSCDQFNSIINHKILSNTMLKSVYIVEIEVPKMGRFLMKEKNMHPSLINEIIKWLVFFHLSLISCKFNVVANPSAKLSCPHVPAKSVGCSKWVKLSVFVILTVFWTAFPLISIRQIGCHSFLWKRNCMEFK